MKDKLFSFILAAIAVSGILLVAGTKPTRALTLAECAEKYRNAKSAGALGDEKWKEFRLTQCHDKSAASPLVTVIPAPSDKMLADVDSANTLVVDTTKGRVVIKLRPDLAPKHAERIKQLARDGYYNNVPFHRVIEGFMAQTGDGQRFNGTGGSKYPNLQAEFSNVPFKRGIVGMARAADPNSANSQFFIMFADGSVLNGKYTVVGEVISGMDAVDKIKRGAPVINPDKMTDVRVASDDPSAPNTPMADRPGSASVSAPSPSASGATPSSVHSIHLTERRLALVIGNSDYSGVSVLPNPRRDADVVAASLRKAGFQTVTVKGDMTRAQMIAALNDFSDQAANADWALVYFSGHGLELGGTNYVVPVDARLRADRDVQDEAVSLDRLLSATMGAKKLHIVILDACRDNPFLPKMRQTVATRSVGRGLARVEPEGATLVVYAARDGQIAYDGDGQNSPFVSSLVKRIAEPNVEINKLFRLVHDDVMAATGKRQEPYVYGALPGEDFFFVQK